MVTVADVWARYQELILSRLAPSTTRSYFAAWRVRVGPSFGAWEVGDLRPLDVELAFASWSGAHSTRVDALATLSAICRTAVKAGLLVANPCTGIERVRLVPYDPAGRALSMVEIERLVAALPSSGPYRRFVLAMLYTGCRLGEVAGLRVSDVDAELGVLQVRRTVSPGRGGRMTVGPTKGRKVRAVPLVEPLRPVVSEAMVGVGEHDYLFPGPRGGHVVSRNLSRALGWDSIRDGIKTFAPGEEPLHFHDLRHTAAVLFFRAGLSAPDVQAILGHSSLAVTQVYADTRHDAAIRGTAAASAFWAANRLCQSGGGESSSITGADLGI
ncbi:tyrosine-type recombinase/integrase [Microbacterium sp.]|uniref:tyrosine-type recombinase/integrase n=1 Tax=Microbacterium sp. TaxID=51671 RepID=UPI0039E21B2D